LVERTLKKSRKSKLGPEKAKRGKERSQHVEEEVDSRDDGGGREDKDDDPHQKPLRAFMESNLFKQGRWKLATPDVVEEPTPPSSKPMAMPRAKAKPRAIPARVQDPVVEEEDGPCEETNGLTRSFYDTMIIV
jgi:hypothetical protein